MAGLGVWELWRARRTRRARGRGGLAVGIGGAVLFSDAVAAHEARFAPIDRMEALEDAAEHAGRRLLARQRVGGVRQVLRPLGSRNDSARSPSRPTSSRCASRRRSSASTSTSTSRRSSTSSASTGSSRAARRWRAARPRTTAASTRTRYYELWRRDRSVEVLDHLPLGSRIDATGAPSCAAVRELAERPAARAASWSPRGAADVPTMDVTVPAGRPVGWVPDAQHAADGEPAHAGSARRDDRTSTAGRYRAWLQLSTGRPMQVRIDGRKVGARMRSTARGSGCRPASCSSRPGQHEVELRRGGGRPLPGDGYNGELGPLALEPVGAEPSLRARRRRASASELCGGRWDWIEAVAAVSATVTVAIPVRNGGPLLGEVLDAVRAQRLDRPVELLVADSGSRDGSARARARRRGATVFAVERFSHGGTRNLLMERAARRRTSRSSPRTPCRPTSTGSRGCWRASRSPTTSALVYGPYRPRPDARRDGRARARRLVRLAGARRRARASTATPTPRGPGAATFFTDANGCVARAAWERVPFRDGALRRGPARSRSTCCAPATRRPSARTPRSCTRTSTRRSTQFRRSFDEWRGAARGLRLGRAGRGRARRCWRSSAACAPTCASLRARGPPPAAARARGARARCGHWTRARRRRGARLARRPAAARACAARCSLERRATFEPLAVTDRRMTARPPHPPVRRAGSPTCWRRGRLTLAVPRRRASSRSALVTFPLRPTPLGRAARLRPPLRRRGGARRARWYREHGRPVTVVIPTYGDPALVDAGGARACARRRDARARAHRRRRRRLARPGAPRARCGRCDGARDRCCCRGQRRLRRDRQPRHRARAAPATTSSSSTPT